MAAVKPTVVLRDDGTLGGARAFHTNDQCKFYALSTPPLRKEVDDELIKLLSLHECKRCASLNSPVDVEHAYRVLRRYAGRALTELRQGDLSAAVGFLEAGLDISASTPAEEAGPDSGGEEE